jgi:hypothetical protein
VEFRKLGSTGLDVSVIGFGAEHLNPQSREDSARLLAAAVDGGISYFDLLGWVDEAKDAFGDAFKGKRDGLVLVAHVGVTEQNRQYSQTRDPQEAEDLINDLLRHMHTDHVEVAQLGNIDGRDKLREAMSKGGILEVAVKLKEQVSSATAATIPAPRGWRWRAALSTPYSSRSTSSRRTRRGATSYCSCVLPGGPASPR